RWYETAMLLLICFTLFRPGFWLDRLQAPFETRPAADIVRVAERIPPGATLRFRALSQSRAGDDVEKLVRLTLRTGESGRERLDKAGLALTPAGAKLRIQTVRSGSEAARYGLAPGDEITAILVPAPRPSRYWFALPGLALLAGIVALQRRRQRAKLAF